MIGRWEAKPSIGAMYVEGAYVADGIYRKDILEGYMLIPICVHQIQLKSWMGCLHQGDAMMETQALPVYFPVSCPCVFLAYRQSANTISCSFVFVLY